MPRRTLPGVSETSRRRRLVARLAGGRAEWVEEVRILPHDDFDPATQPRTESVAPPAEPPTDFPVAVEEPNRVPRPAPAYRPAAANPGPLPEPLPPPLDAVVRGLREDLLAAGGDAAGLADEICARHRDRLRAVLAGLAAVGPGAIGPGSDDDAEDVRLRS